jgi:type I restriction enzyme M protein
MLVQSMNVRNPGVVVDLGAGDGALVGEAANLWGDCSFVTVDVDHNALSHRLPHLRGSRFRHYVGDALDLELSSKLAIDPGSVDSALCNPPYIQPKWQSHFGELLEDAGLSQVLPRMQDAPADLMFIAQNLRLLKSGGKLGLIVPDGIIAGEHFVVLRTTLARRHQIERVIELPRRIFKNTDAKAHIMVLTKQAPTGADILIQQIDAAGSISDGLFLPVEQAGHRLDYSYLHANQGNRKRKGNRLGASLINISRGPYSTVERKGAPIPVFHTTDFSRDPIVPARFFLSKLQQSKCSGRMAQPGDILIARVGRNLEGKVCRVMAGTVAVSDCIFVLTLKAGHQAKIYDFLRSANGKTALHAAAHGVGARFITVKALAELRIS